MATTEAQQRQGRRRREDPAQAAARRHHHLWLLVVALLLTFIGTLPGGFVWTDHRDLEQAGARLHDWSELPRAFTLTQEQFRESRLGTTPPEARGAWRPLVILNYTLDHWLVGDCAPCLHLENLLWHAVCVFGLYALGRRLLARRSHGKTLAFWSTLLFAVHPIVTVPVAFIGSRDLLLGNALAIAALVALSRLPATTGSHPRRTFHWLLAVPLLTLAALLSHEAMLALPALALLLAWFEMRERGRRGLGAIGPSRRLAIALMLLAVALYLLLRMRLVGLASADGLPGVGVAQHLGTLLSLFWHSVGQVIWPGEPVVSDAWPLEGLLNPAAVSGLLALLVLLGAVVWGLGHHHPVALGATWFGLWYLPVSGVVPLQHLHDDGHLYPAAWGLLLALVFVGYRLWRPLGRQLSRGAEALVFTPAVLILATITALSGLRFHDDPSLFNGEIDQDPYYLEGRVMLARHALRQAQPLEALNHGLRALEAVDSDQPTNAAHWPAADGHQVLAEAELALALLDDARRDFSVARDLAPHRAGPWYGLGLVDLQQDKPAAAVAELRAALQRRPDHLPTRLRLGEALLRSGQREEGFALLLPLVSSGEADADALLAISDAYAAQGRQRAATAHLQLALQQRHDPALRARLARQLWREGKQDQAQQQIALALQEAGDDPLVNEVAMEIATGFPTLPGTP